MNLLKKVHHSDLLLLRDLFCGRECGYIIYDPLCCLSGNEMDSCINRDNVFHEPVDCKVLFNLSYEKLPNPAGAEYVFNFNLKNNSQKNTFHYINNRDGTMRWIYPSSAKAPYFLDLYNSGTLKANIYRLVVKTAFGTGFANKVSSGSFYLQQKSGNKVEVFISGDENEEYSIFTGTIGENRKSIISLHTNGEASHYIKVAFNEKPKELIKNEKRMLTTLSKYDFTSLSLPQVSVAIDPNYVKVTSIKPGVIISSNRLRDVHLKALGELYLSNHEHKKIKNTPAWATISNQLNLLDKEHDILNNLDATVVYGIVQKLFDLHNSIDTETEIPVSFAHGDFTPWNMYTDDHRLYVYDWELAGAGMPMLMDLFHFVFQTQVLIFRKDMEAISSNIQEALGTSCCIDIIKKYKINTNLHYKLYLLFNISYYIRLYMNQSQLHTQAHWLVSTWYQALKEVS